MTVTQRTLFITNGKAYNILDTIAYVYDHGNALGDLGYPVDKFDHIVAVLSDLQFGPYDFHAQGLPVPDVYSGVIITMSMFFLRYGITDRTIEYFDGADQEYVGEFEIPMIELTDISEETITSDEELDLIAGSLEHPIILDLGDSMETIIFDDDDSIVVV